MGIVLALCSANRSLAGEVTVRFNRDVRPILSTYCLPCHGADAATREADLRLDDQDSVTADRGGYRVLAAGDPEASELFRRITSNDPLARMPPPETGRGPSAAEIALLRRWIEEGHAYEPHWSFLPLQRPAVPSVQRGDWPRNAIDHFVLARLEREGFVPSPAADKPTWLRRASLDVTGLPPALDELDEFLSDAGPGARQRATARLFASPHYGEQRARHWLDVARYADTNGYFTDDERSMWRWRDWLIDALNRNLPFDQFTIEQLAGDLLPEATLEQRIATGFNRNHMVTHETGVIDEEYRIEYVVDRLNTTATAWLGLSVGCARCHDHKFDPITQQEFYELFAFFNAVPEKGNAGHGGNTQPLLPVPAPELLAEIGTLESQATETARRLQDVQDELEAAQRDWAREALSVGSAIPTGGLLLHHALDDAPSSRSDATLRSIGTVGFKGGLVGHAAHFDGDAVLEGVGDLGLDRDVAFSFGAWIHSDRSGPVCVLSKNDDVAGLRGFDLMLRKGKAVVHLVHRWPSNAIQVMTGGSVATGRWTHLMVTYDGTSTAAGIQIYVDGEAQVVEVHHDSLSASIATAQPLRVGRRSTSAPFVGMIDEVRIYRRELSGAEVRQLVHAELVQGILGVPPEKRTQQQNDKLRAHFLDWHADDHLRKAKDAADRARQELQKLRETIPTTMVMQEMEQPRTTFVLQRGQYDAPGEKVVAEVPRCLPPLAGTATRNRLGLAEWLVDPVHPLTARVAVNRLWQEYFGAGIVRTAEDFGTQGDWPSHPDLLDWLAVEFIESGWDLKHIQRLIVSSATYQQASAAPPDTTAAAGEGEDRPGQRVTAAMDPENRLLARGPRSRLDAESIRDNALAISGLLVRRLKGPSVKPYQPAGLWEAVSYDGSASYQQDSGADLYRRGLYTFWKRQSPPPSMLAFDAPTRETCTIRRPRTNTPLQALVLMNDPTYVEAARALAERMLKEFPGSDLNRIASAFRVSTARWPQADELRVMADFYRAQLKQYQLDIDAAQALLRVGETSRLPTFDTARYAALTTVASMILNLDETISKR